MLVFAIGAAAPLIAQYPKGYSADILLAPSRAHIFGTDKLGLDVFSQVVWGARTSLFVSATSVAITALIGVPLGLASGYFKGPIGAAIDSAIEIFLALPALPLMIVTAAVLGSSISNVALIIGLLSWPSLARVTRNSTIKTAEMPYIEAARCAGLSAYSIMFRHILINAIGPVLVNLTMAMASAILSESGMSFLGLGDPNTWSWGLMLKRAWDAGAILASPNPWWWWLFPSLFIMAYVVSFNLFGNGINDALNPKGREG
jgi:peptide/nickel transport system permease protein